MTMLHLIVKTATLAFLGDFSHGRYIVCTARGSQMPRGRARMFTSSFIVFPYETTWRDPDFSLGWKKRYICHGFSPKHIKREEGRALYSNYSRSILFVADFVTLENSRSSSHTTNRITEYTIEKIPHILDTCIYAAMISLF